MTDRTQTLPTYEGAGTTKRILTPLTASRENDVKLSSEAVVSLAEIALEDRT